MQVITLPRLRLNQLQILAETSISLCADIATLAPAVAQVQTAFNGFMNSMDKESARSQRDAYDTQRDNALIGFELHLKSQRYYSPHSEATQTALKQLSELLNAHDSVKLRYLPMSEQSAAMDNLVKALQAFDFGPLADTQLQAWVSLIEQENTAFKEVSKAWLSQSAAAEQAVAPSSLAPALRDQLHQLYTLLAASRVFHPDDKALSHAEQQIQQLVDSFK